MGQSTDTALAALKIGGRVAYERLARPKARQFDDVPCTPYAVTPEWLTAVLCGKVPGGRRYARRGQTGERGHA
jgi:hypothetical protein